MRRLLLVSLLAAGFSVALFAGSAHFVGSPVISVSGSTVTASGKIAGLGGEPQVHVVLTGDAACVNPGTKRPKADNKESFSAEGDFPVQNGKANFSLSLTADIQPTCTGPMTIVWSDVQVCFLEADGTEHCS